MRKIRKKYQTPKHPWQAQRINDERALTKRYGLKNKREVWRAIALLRNWRAQARKLVGLSESERVVKQKELFAKLQSYSMLADKADLDDILSLGIEAVLDKRLQTVVYKQGLASTAKQARQFVVHGKVLVNRAVINSPAYKVKKTDKVNLIAGFNPKIRNTRIVDSGKTDVLPVEAVVEAAPAGEVK